MDEDKRILLQSCNNHTISDFTLCGISAYCKVVDIYDADTFRVIFFKNETSKELMKIKVRGAGYNSPEMYPLKSHHNRDVEMKKARLARNRLLELVCDVKIDVENTNYSKSDIEKILDENKKIVFITFHKFDKYGRVLGTLYDNKNDVISINKILIDENHAVEYNGEKRNKEELTIS